MLTPFQKLLYNGFGSRKILVAASGPSLRTFDYLTGQIISTWSYLDPQSSAGDKSPSPHEEDENLPRKKRKLDNGNASDSESAEILIENGSGRQKPKRRGFAVPCITHMTRTTNGKHIVIVTGEDKTIRVLEMVENGRLHQFSQRVLPKRPSALTLDPEEGQILCSDKFGDVYSMPLLGQTREGNTNEATTQLDDAPIQELFQPSANYKTVHSKRNLLALEAQQKQKKVKKATALELQFDHSLILGHVSLLTDIASVRLKTREGRGRSYILTSDRDEHIRVSRGVPQAHIIENFCLGHEQFISKIHILPWQPETLISGGGDDYLLSWNWREGTIVDKVELRSLLKLSQPDLRDIDTLPISVSGIWSIKSALGSGSVIVTCEKTSGLFIFPMSSEGKTITSQAIFKPLSNNVLDVEVIQHEQRIVVSFDNMHRPWSTEVVPTRDHSPFIVVLQLLSDGTWIETQELAAINSHAQQTTEPLTKSLEPMTWSSVYYNMEHLRKRGPFENVEEEP